MKITCPPPQVIFVGFESNQQGQAASQEHASSSWPVTFQGAFFSSSRAFAAAAAESRTMTARTDFRRMLYLLFSCSEKSISQRVHRVSILLWVAPEVNEMTDKYREGVDPNPD